MFGQSQPSITLVELLKWHEQQAATLSIGTFATGDRMSSWRFHNSAAKLIKEIIDQQAATARAESR